MPVSRVGSTYWSWLFCSLGPAADLLLFLVAKLFVACHMALPLLSPSGATGVCEALSGCLLDRSNTRLSDEHKKLFHLNEAVKRHPAVPVA